MKKLRILILDDEDRLREELIEFLEENGFSVVGAALPSEAFRLLEQEEADIMILDIRLPEMNGLEVLAKVKDEYPDMEVIMVSGHGDMRSVIEAMRRKATDYFTKPFRLVEVQGAIERSKRFIELNRKVKELEKNYNRVSEELHKHVGHRIIGSSEVMRTILELMRRVASTNDTSVLITGESGTGKELVARGIHMLSDRKDHYFHSVNCSAIPRELFESEFFGHSKGAYTGATETKAGWFEIADKGTLFLDEIVDMDPLLQSKFLRVLEEKMVTRVGSTKEQKVNVRIIAATNQDIEGLVKVGKFRVDLFHRLNTFHIELPPLRSRREDIATLLEYFVKMYASIMGKSEMRIEQRIFQVLFSYDFPGNVRELRNMVERAMILSDGKTLKLENFTMPGHKPKPGFHAELTEGANEDLDLERMEERLVRRALDLTNNNKAHAARMLNVSWQSLDRRMKKFNLD